MELVETGFKQTEVGLIPVDWEVVELGSILKFGSGKDYKELSTGDIPVYGTGGIMTYVNDYLYDGNSVGIGRKGTIDKPVFLSGKFWTVDTLFYTHSFIDTIPKFIYYQFCLIPWKEYNEASGVPSLNKNTLENIKIPLPPTLKEQKAIATALSDVDALIHSLEALIAKKKAIKQGAMQELLTGKTRLAGFENDKGYKQTEVGLIPVDWEVKTLGELGECIIGLTYSPSNVSKSGVLVLRSSNIQGNQLAFHDNVYVDMKIPDKLRTKKGDILVCVRNGSRRLIGKCAVIDGRCTNETFGAFMSMYRSEYNDFIAHAFQSYSIQRQIEENLGATINQITNKTLNSFIVSMPRNNEERISIAKTLSEFDQEIQALQAKKEKYQGIKQGMMQELLTGKTRLISSSL